MIVVSGRGGISYVYFLLFLDECNDVMTHNELNIDDIFLNAVAF